MKLAVEIDQKIVDLGYDLREVWTWVHFGKLESEHRELMVKVFVHLLNLGYKRHDLTG